MRVAIVGAGVAGLVAARRLAQLGHGVRVLEAADAPGGMIRPARLAGLQIDIGAEAFAVRGGAVAELVVELGLTAELVEPRALGSWGYQDGEAYAQPKGGLFGLPPGPDAAGLEAAVGPEGVAAVAHEATLDPHIGADAANLADLVRARYGERILHRLVAPVTRGVYSLDPELMRVDALLPGVLEQLRKHGSLGAVVRDRRAAAWPGALVRSVRGGMHRFVAALVADCERLGVAFEYGARLRHLDELPEHDSAIVTVPPSDDFPYLGGARAGEGVLSEVVALLLDAPALDAHPRGTGLLVAPSASGADPVRAKALTHVTAKWPWLDEATGAGRHIVRLSYANPADASPQQALADASALLGTPLDAEQLVDQARQLWHMPPPPARLGAAQTRAKLQDAVADLPPNIRCIGTWIAGTGLASVVPQANQVAQELQNVD
ncbi:protoporphyrinogen/coproporphyrinogen oxidase [Gulosibacter sp. ACHW.36C]|uniref:protoporphyrinogen/coproporphyrinogen oxidase n=1 Tax=Gulosibacter sp. ACHW.36C TaxID=3434457 RepID=UPI0024B57A81|nr:FAD-dependent oxidoreductase [Gulosibacter sediminis]